jgi:30S ribosomal protein S31
MGRGDIKTKKGKISNGSFGKSRPAKKNAKKVVAKKA